MAPAPSLQVLRARTVHVGAIACPRAITADEIDAYQSMLPGWHGYALTSSTDAKRHVLGATAPSGKTSGT